MDNIQAVVADLAIKGERDVLKSTQSLSLLMRAYNALYNEKLCGQCKKDLRNAYRKLVTWHSQNKDRLMSGKFKLQKGFSAPLKFGSSVHINTANLTDDLAHEFLAVNPNRIKFFIDYPSDWRVRIGIDAPGEKSPEVLPEKKKAEVMTADVKTVRKIIIE